MDTTNKTSIADTCNRRGLVPVENASYGANFKALCFGIGLGSLMFGLIGATIFVVGRLVAFVLKL